MKFFLPLSVCAVLLAASARAETLAERLLEGYGRIETVACEVRREVEVQGKSVRTLSRVFFQRPDRLHVESAAPFKRRIVADGAWFFDHTQEAPKGYSKPIAELDEARLIQLRKVPGTAMDSLLRLRGLPEEELEAQPGWPVRRGYVVGSQFVVLSMDGEGRLGRVEAFSAGDRGKPVAVFSYSRFVEAVPGVWLPQAHEARMEADGQPMVEKLRVENLRINQPIDPKRFDAKACFEGVTFVGDFMESLGIPPEP